MTGDMNNMDILAIDKDKAQRRARMLLEVRKARQAKAERKLDEEWAWECVMSAKEKEDSLRREEERKERARQEKLARNRQAKALGKEVEDAMELARLWEDSEGVEVEYELQVQLVAGLVEGKG